MGKRLQDLKEGVPVGRSMTVDVRNEHATYAIIWYVQCLSRVA